MYVFLDFEASSLANKSHPIEIGWVTEDGEEEQHLIRPAPGWTDWSEESEAIHRISRATLDAEGRPHDLVARRMVDVLTGHDLLASAPSWDGKWLSTLLRAAGFPRHTLRLRDTEDAWRETAMRVLAPSVPPDQLDEAVENVLATVGAAYRQRSPAHRALADARQERGRWLAIRSAAEDRAGKDRPAASR